MARTWLSLCHSMYPNIIIEKATWWISPTHYQLLLWKLLEGKVTLANTDMWQKTDVFKSSKRQMQQTDQLSWRFFSPGQSYPNRFSSQPSHGWIKPPTIWHNIGSLYYSFIGSKRKQGYLIIISIRPQIFVTFSMLSYQRSLR